MRGLPSHCGQFEETIRAVGALPAESVPPAVRDDLLTAFQHWSAPGENPG
ncbi:hypothetical protein FAGKG844_500011 [Frankia sp. AgKG'84/4]